MLLFKKFGYVFPKLRLYSTKLASSTNELCDATGSRKGLVIGAYDSNGCETAELSTAGKAFDSSTGGKITELLKGLSVKTGTVHTFTNVSTMYSEVAVAGIGKKTTGFNEYENLDEFKENARVAAGIGSRVLQDHGIENITIESFEDEEAAAEGSHLGIWQYQENKEDKKNEATVSLSDGNKDQWDRGILKAECQNIVRCLCEIPANLMTPVKFCRRAMDIICPYGVEVFVRDRRWMENNKMHGVLTSAKGSCEPPYFMQINYCGSHPSEKPTILIGKGTTFNCGGLCIKDCEGMSEFRADMCGAAIVVAVIKAAAAMRLPMNIYGLIPLFENMISGMTLKPGDVVLAKNKKLIRNENTDDYSRVALSDVIQYSEILRPDLILTVGTMSAGIRGSLGFGPSAVFSPSDAIWEQLAFAGSITGDRMWRMPLFKDYTDLVTGYTNCDVNNVGKGIGGGAALGATFLLEFSPKNVDFAYIDNTGTGMLSNGFIPYLRHGLMSGRPTRTLIQFLCHRAYDCDRKPHKKPLPDDCRDK
uniref:Cytosol aminopeptidase n=1 Tax=Clastoptera arizonana TaxID=38151 RepID=A0A1B6C2I6_9HEMI